jgi:hypothetical protein
MGIIIGCTRLVTVVDLTGKPISGASVAPVSIGHPIAVTDDHGVSSGPLYVGGRDSQWVYVTKDGYEPQFYRLQEAAPAVVYLKRAGDSDKK